MIQGLNSFQDTSNKQPKAEHHMMLRFNSITPQTYTPPHHNAPSVRRLQKCNPNIPPPQTPQIPQSPNTRGLQKRNPRTNSPHTIMPRLSVRGLQKCNPKTLLPPPFAGYKNATQKHCCLPRSRVYIYIPTNRKASPTSSG